MQIINCDGGELIIALIYIYTCGYVATVATFILNPLILLGLTALGVVATRKMLWLPVATALKPNSKLLY